MKNCRMMNVASTLGAPKIGTRISGQCVSIIPSRLNIWNSGTIVTSLGISRPVEHDHEQRVCPGNRMRGERVPRQGRDGHACRR